MRKRLQKAPGKGALLLEPLFGIRVFLYIPGSFSSRNDAVHPLSKIGA